LDPGIYNFPHPRYAHNAGEKGQAQEKNKLTGFYKPVRTTQRGRFEGFRLSD
jgi:hypothetical protein